MLRSRPGPLPYHMEKIPSCRQSPNDVACWVPQIAVAAKSSLMAGWKWMLESGRNRFADHSSLSMLCIGEPR